MLLAIDVGNTNISCGIFDGNNLVTKFRFITKSHRTADELALSFHSIISVRDLNEDNITDVIISSVVPTLNRDLMSAVEQCFHVKALMIAPGVKTGLTIKIDDPKSTGADLIVDCVAAYHKYKRDVLVVDFGTATKFLYVSSKCEFLYGVISPGLEITANSLWNMTAQLPSVSLTKPESILTKSTVPAMQAGIMYGYIGLTEKIITEFKKEINSDFPVLATGGLGRYLVAEIKSIDEYDPDLAYFGMKEIYEKNK